MSVEITIHGIEPCPKEKRDANGGVAPYSEHLTLTVDGERRTVPVTNLRRAYYDYHGDVPESVDMNCVFMYDGRIHADVELTDRAIELYPVGSVNPSWCLEAFDLEPNEPADKVLWERDD